MNFPSKRLSKIINVNNYIELPGNVKLFKKSEMSAERNWGIKRFLLLTLPAPSVERGDNIEKGFWAGPPCSAGKQHRQTFIFPAFRDML